MVSLSRHEIDFFGTKEILFCLRGGKGRERKSRSSFFNFRKCERNRYLRNFVSEGKLIPALFKKLQPPPPFFGNRWKISKHLILV